MSDLEEQATAVENEELSKEERLEAARKKYEELKKKKAKKSKKKSKKKGEDSPAPEDEDKPDEDEVEESKQDNDVETSDVTEPAEESHEPVSKGVDTSATQPVGDSVDEPPESLANPKDNTPPVESQDSTSFEQTGINTPTDIVTPSEVTLLKDTIAQQEKTIKKLRDENTDLKLNQMDMKDKINELEATIEKLKNGASNVPVQLSRKLEPAKPVFTKNDYASSSQPDFSDFNRISDFRERLMVWKNWQVDMTQWNSTYTTEKVIL